MALSLKKGENVNLSRDAPGLNVVHIGLAWDERATDGPKFDLDLSAFLLDESGRVRSDADFIFYNQLTGLDGAIRHLGDEREGAREGDDEIIKLELGGVPADVARIVFAATVDEADSKRQSFGMVPNAGIRILDDASGTEIARYDLSEDASTETAMIFGELYRHGNDWKFRAVGQGFEGGLNPLARKYGINFD